jgi:hypothetical protein
MIVVVVVVVVGVHFDHGSHGQRSHRSRDRSYRVEILDDMVRNVVSFGAGTGRVGRLHHPHSCYIPELLT